MNSKKPQKNKSQPLVSHDYEKGELQIKGKSYETTPYEFYKSLRNDIDSYKLNKLNILISIDYLNTLSAKHLLETLKHAKNSFRELAIVWEFEDDDTVSLELGQTFYEILNVPFSFSNI